MPDSRLQTHKIPQSLDEKRGKNLEAGKIQ